MRAVTSPLARTELRRGVLRPSTRDRVAPEITRAAAQQAEALLGRVDLVAVSAEALDRAGRQHPSQLRSLDAVHLATALGLGQALDAVLAYDERLAAACADAGLLVRAPTA